METEPSAPKGTVTWLEVVAPAAGSLRADVSGLTEPDGHTVTNPGPAASVAVTLSTTAATPDFGTGPTPAIFRFTTDPAAGRSPWYPIWSGPGRVSRMRAGELATNEPVG